MPEIFNPLSGSLKFTSNVAYNPNQKRNLFLTNPFTMPTSEYKSAMEQWKQVPNLQTPVQQYGNMVDQGKIQMPNSLIKNPSAPVANPTIPAQTLNPPTQQQANQTPLAMPNSLLNNPVAQGFANPVQQPQRPKIYMPDFMGARRPFRNWDDAFAIANLR